MIRKSSLLLCITLTSGMFLITMKHGWANNAVSVFEQVKNSVVVVKTFDAVGKPIKQGSGVIVEQNKIATNCHVLDGGAKFEVGLGKISRGAILLTGDFDKDLCTLRIELPIGKPVRIGSTTKMRIGESVYAVGSPRGLDLTISDGIISQLRGERTPLIQTTASISPGSSGGGLFNLHGELIGITTFNVTGGQSLNFALPVEWLENLPVALDRGAKESGAPDWQTQAAALVAAKDWQGLISWSERWQKNDPNNAMSWYFHGIANLNLSKWDQTIKSLSESVRIQPKFSLAWHVLGLAYSFNAQFEIARDALQEALKLNPSNAEYWDSLGYVLTRTRSFDEAANAYKKAIEISPQAKYWKGLGDVYAMKNLAQDHKRIVASPWNLNPKKETTYDQSDNSDRIEAYRQAVKLDQDYVPAWFSLAQVLNTARKCGEAEEAIAEIRKRDPAKALELASWHRRRYGPCEGR